MNVYRKLLIASIRSISFLTERCTNFWRFLVESTQPNQKRTRWFIGCEITLPLWLVPGCSRAPSFDIVGSFFPAWLVCLVIGILLAALTRWLLLRQQIVVSWSILVYPSLAALFTFLFWLIFFS